jgi:hypothetical protein
VLRLNSNFKLLTQADTVKAFELMLSLKGFNTQNVKNKSLKLYIQFKTVGKSLSTLSRVEHKINIKWIQRPKHKGKLF